MAALQRPKWAYFGGGVRPYGDAMLHVSSEAVVRGLNVFEGIKGYWQPDGTFALLELERHYARLLRSARLLHIPVSETSADYQEACFGLMGALLEPANDMWVRTTLFVTEGHWGEGTVSDLVLTAYQQPKNPPTPVHVGTSTWQRAADLTLPARIKTSTNYQVARLARIEGRARGCQEMVLLNQWGRVAEFTGCALLMVRDGAMISPPPYEGALESITVDIVRELCVSMGIPFERRPIERTELLIADELAMCGTLVEVQRALSVDGQPLPDQAPITTAIAQRYQDAVRGVDPHPAVHMTTLHVAAQNRGVGSLDAAVTPGGLAALHLA